jgi:hypothetical protein
MNPVHIIKKLVTAPSYFFGRFYTFRKTYSLYKSIVAPISRAAHSSDSLFDVNTVQIVNDLEQNAVGFGFNLPTHIVNKISDFARNAPLVRWDGNTSDIFFYKDVIDGKVATGKVALAEVQNKEQLPELFQIAQDPKLLETARQYLGYQNLQTDIRLFWSFVANFTEAERLQMNQTVKYHFDVHSWNFCYLHIYLTDCTKESGAHEMILGSHKDKPLNWLWGGANRDDEAIKTYYEANKILTIEGKAGTGFLEDTSCYHRAIAPQKGERLLLQIRFF